MSNKPFNLLTGANLPTGSTMQVSQKKDPSVQLSEDLFHVYKGSRANWETQAKEDEDFRNGAQWSKAQDSILRRRKQMPIVVNCIHPAVEQAKAMLTTHPPRFSVTGREESDSKTAKIIGDMLSYVWDISSATVELKIAIDDYYVKGVGWLMTYADFSRDSGNGEVCIRAIDPYDVYVDPNSKDIFCRDAAHILIVNNLSFEQLQRMYPMYTDKILSAQPNLGTNHPTSGRVGYESQTDQVNDTYHQKYQVVDRYSRIKTGMYKITEFSDGDQRVLNDQDYQVFLASPIVAIVAQQDTKILIDETKIQEAIKQFGQSGVFHYELDQNNQPQVASGPTGTGNQNEIPNSDFQVIIDIANKIIPQFPDQVRVQQILQDGILRVLSVGSVLIYQSELPMNDYPITPLMNHHMRNPYPMSDVRFVRSLQEYVNKITSLIVAHASSSANVKVLIPRGSQSVKKIEEEFNKAGAAVVEFDAEFGQPIIASPIPLPNELYKNRDDAKADIDKIFGIWSVSAGDPSSTPDTYKGTIALDEFGQRRIRSKKDDIEGALNQLGAVVIQLMQKIYTKSKVIRIVQPNNVSKTIELNKTYYDDLGNIINRFNDITVGKYDVQVISGSTLPSNRWARFEYYMSLYEKGIIDQTEVLKQTEVVDMDGVLERMDTLRQLQQNNVQLQEQIKKLSGDLQTFERESVHDRKRVEVEKFKSELNSQLETIRAAGELYQARLTDELSRTKLINKKREKESLGKKD